MKRRGRLPLADAPATSRIEIRVSPAQRVELQRIADINGLRLSTMIREAVNVYAADSGERLPLPRNFYRTKS